MNTTRTALEQDVIDYVNDAQEIHEKALQYFNTMSEIRTLLLMIQDRSKEIQMRLIFQYIPETAAQKLYDSGSDKKENETNNKPTGAFKKSPSKKIGLGMEK